ncbi:hypothetical protein SLS62_001921 [Diatrype stigma]|uniref:Uncharacterized protein n=1 Tax=Diatrype stigma TaxID=117547 RepID=A0AAN9UUV7_9PEZI
MALYRLWPAVAAHQGDLLPSLRERGVTVRLENPDTGGDVHSSRRHGSRRRARTGLPGHSSNKNKNDDGGKGESNGKGRPEKRQGLGLPAGQAPASVKTAESIWTWIPHPPTATTLARDPAYRRTSTMASNNRAQSGAYGHKTGPTPAPAPAPTQLQLGSNNSQGQAPPTPEPTAATAPTTILHRSLGDMTRTYIPGVSEVLPPSSSGAPPPPPPPPPPRTGARPGTAGAGTDIGAGAVVSLLDRQLGDMTRTILYGVAEDVSSQSRRRRRQGQGQKGAQKQKQKKGKTAKTSAARRRWCDDDDDDCGRYDKGWDISSSDDYDSDYNSEDSDDDGFGSSDSDLCF